MDSILALIGQDIEFNSDPEDSIGCTTHMHTGQVLAVKKYKKQISIKLNSNEHIHNYFIDEIQILSIRRPQPVLPPLPPLPPPPKRHYRTHANSISGIPKSITNNLSITPTSKNSNTETVSIKFGNNSIKTTPRMVPRRRSLTNVNNRRKYTKNKKENTTIVFQRCKSESNTFNSTSKKSKFASVTNALSKSWINFSKNKRKKNKKSNIKSKSNINYIFGIDPLELEYTIIPPLYKAGIPNILIKLKNELFINNGHLTEGIFRKAPNANECTRIKLEINSGKDIYKCMNFKDIPAILIANLIKIWYRDLPMNILETVNCNKIEIIENISIKKRIGYVENIVNNDIIEPYKSYFKWLLDLCIDIVKYKKVNKMTCKNMAVVVSPNLYDPMKIGNPTKLFTMSGCVVVFLQIAIQWRMEQHK